MEHAENDPRYQIHVSAQTRYLPEQSDPDAKRFTFAYTITIRNAGSESAKLLNRHWIVTDANGKTQEVRGAGVVGEQPHLQPGESFEYTSGTQIETPLGSMHGSYDMIADDGTRFDAVIQPFSLGDRSGLH
ncbi:Co2+/Mg2+ efflux protein ApaG [Halochromatium glycolicum]|uniref:Protein ApaG n=1 Tax=Halochromatium glycolicum TaxID=85075 RepID=A0AAJ0U5Z8_9GAMM|nr:Co2+/Mg2+ efflux protein ApaG [Halochromatium glycolicum]MBK1705909.1 Co2+/Mg2+ efflux protein ApaG [Halochromatium glycolicum]